MYEEDNMQNDSNHYVKLDVERYEQVLAENIENRLKQKYKAKIEKIEKLEQELIDAREKTGFFELRNEKMELFNKCSKLGSENKDLVEKLWMQEDWHKKNQLKSWIVAMGDFSFSIFLLSSFISIFYTIYSIVINL